MAFSIFFHDVLGSFNKLNEIKSNSLILKRSPHLKYIIKFLLNYTLTICIVIYERLDIKDNTKRSKVFIIDIWDILQELEALKIISSKS